MPVRSPITMFQLANPLYANALVSFWSVANGQKTSVLADLFASPVGDQQIENPTRLNSQGQFKASVYIEEQVIGSIAGISVPAHDTPILSAAPIFRVVESANPQLEYSFDNGLSWYVSGPISPVGGAGLINYLPSGTGATERTVFYEFDNHIISPLRFMSEVQRNDVLGHIGSVDVTAALQNWLDYLMTHKASGLWLAGSYLHSDTLLIESGDITLIGQGRNTKLIRTGDFGDSIAILGTGPVGAGSWVENVGIFDIQIESHGLTTSGSLLRMDGLRFGEFRGIHLRDGFEQITVEGSTQLQFRHVYGVCTNIYGGSPTGRTLCRFKEDGGNSPTATNSAVYMSDYNFSGSPSSAMFDYALSIEQESDGHFMSNGHVGSAGIANALFDQTGASSGHNLSLIFISNFMSDKCFGTGVTFRGGRAEASPGHTILLSNWQLRGGTTGVNGIHVESDANFAGVAFSNFQIDQFDRRALFVESDLFRHFSFTNPMFMDNSLEGVGLYPQVEFGPLCGYGSFVGGRVGGKQSGGGVAQNSCAFKFDDTSTRVMVQAVKCNLNNGSQAFEGVGDGTILVDNPFLDELESLDLASASTLTIPLGHDFATITGNTQIDNITPRPHEAGPLMLRFTGNPTVKHISGGTGNIRLGGSDFVPVAGVSTLTLICESLEPNRLWYKVAST